MKSDRLDPQLAAVLTHLAAREPALSLPFLVTLVPDARAAVVVPFKPKLDIPVTRLVSGDMTARQALDLARDARVERIEFDGTAQALEELAARE